MAVMGLICEPDLGNGGAAFARFWLRLCLAR